jgi:hypothetical protein
MIRLRHSWLVLGLFAGSALAAGPDGAGTIVPDLSGYATKQSGTNAIEACGLREDPGCHPAQPVALGGQGYLLVLPGLTWQGGRPFLAPAR